MLTEKEKRIVRALQNDLPLVPEPWDEIAGQLDMTPDELMEAVRRLLENGSLKRIGAALYHNNVGYTVNSLLVWDVPPERIHQAGEALAGHPRVTHCYERSRMPEFDYNLYSMVHATSEEEYRQLAEELAALVRPLKYAELRTLSELKKSGMKYFME